MHCCLCVCVSAHIVNPLSAHRVRGWLGLSEMQAQAYLIWIMYKTLIGAVCLHQSGEQKKKCDKGKDRVVERDSEGEREHVRRCVSLWGETGKGSKGAVGYL